MRLKTLLVSALILLALGVIIWRPWSDREPHKTGPPPGKIDSLVIFPFRVSGLGEYWKWLEIGLVDLFATRLNYLPGLRAMSLEELLERPEFLTLRDSSDLSAEIVFQHHRTDALLRGDVSALEKGIRLGVTVVGRARREPLLEDGMVVNGSKELFQAIDSLSLKVAEALGWMRPSGLASTAQVTSRSVQALSHYMMAVQDYVISDDSSLSRAADHLRTALSVDSSFARAHFLLAKVCDQAEALGVPQGSAEKPLMAANRFAERLPEWERQYALGWQLWLVERDLERAASVLTGLSENYPDYAWQEGVPLTLGRLLAHQGLWRQATEQLKDYVLDAHTPPVRKTLGWGQLATAYEMTGDVNRAIEALQQQLALFSGREGNRAWWIQENMALALLHFENGQQGTAEEILARAQEMVSSDARGLTMIGLARLQMQQQNRAEALAQKALRLQGNLPLAHYLRGIISLRRKELWRAVADLEAACSQEFNWDYLYHAALAHDRRGARQNAEELLQIQLEILGGDSEDNVAPADLGLRGILLARLGRFDEALTHGMRALQRYPGPQAKYDLACIYAIGGDKAKAMEWLKNAFADGYVRRRQSRSDFDLENLWYDPDFILMTAGK